MDRLELKIPPLAVFAVCVGLLWLPSRLFRVPALTGSITTALALFLLLAGLLTAVAGVLAFRRHHTTVSPLAPGRAARVVSTGIYRWSRNPMYLGMLLVLAAVAVYHGSAGGVVVLPLFVWYLNRFQIAPEERALLDKFGSEYAAYARKVRRWL